MSPVRRVRPAGPTPNRIFTPVENQPSEMWDWADWSGRRSMKKWAESRSSQPSRFNAGQSRSVGTRDREPWN